MWLGVNTGGGANDGKWHGPATGFGIHVLAEAMGPAGKSGSLHLDDVTCVAGDVTKGEVTVHSMTPPAVASRPGFQAYAAHHFDAQPLGREYTAFVHCLNEKGETAFQADFKPNVSTSTWSGQVDNDARIYVPIGMPAGDYRVVLGLYQGSKRVTMRIGDGVTEVEPGSNAYVVGTLKVDPNAAIPPIVGKKLDLSDYTMTFNDEFKDLSVGVDDPSKRWSTATKGQFGDAQFVPQQDGFPFSIVQDVLPQKSVLRIEAAKRNGRWQSGIMSSCTPKGEGFTQKFGYFEIRAKFPNIIGMWPGFWMLGKPRLAAPNTIDPEIDVVEWYGQLPNVVHQTTHDWYPDGRHTAMGDTICAPGLTEEFHTYGVMIDEEELTYYFDGTATQTIKAPETVKVPMYMIVNLAMGGGWPIDKTTSPGYMYVDHIRAYSKK